LSASEGNPAIVWRKAEQAQIFISAAIDPIDSDFFRTLVIRLG
jgi:hypothetical protein